MSSAGRPLSRIWVFPITLFPILSSLIWLGMLLGMLLWWVVVQGRPIYASMQAGQTIAYISDVGAQELKPLFIAGSAATTVLLDLSILADRWLRHRAGSGLAPNTSRAQKALAVLSLVFAAVGTAGLILLSVFDTLRYPRLHDIFLSLFIAGYVVCAVFLCAEYQRLGMRYRELRVLRTSFWLKLAFVLVEVALAVAFGALNRTKLWNAAAIVEWVIALIFSFWVLSFVVDLWPALQGHKDRGGGVVKAERYGMGSEESGISSQQQQHQQHQQQGPLASGGRDGRTTNLAGNF